MYPGSNQRATEGTPLISAPIPITTVLARLRQPVPMLISYISVAIAGAALGVLTADLIIHNDVLNETIAENYKVACITAGLFSFVLEGSIFMFRTHQMENLKFMNWLFTSIGTAFMTAYVLFLKDYSQEAWISCGFILGLSLAAKLALDSFLPIDSRVAPNIETGAPPLPAISSTGP